MYDDEAEDDKKTIDDCFDSIKEIESQIYDIDEKIDEINNKFIDLESKLSDLKSKLDENIKMSKELVEEKRKESNPWVVIVLILSITYYCSRK